jgi:hypothetical protein
MIRARYLFFSTILFTTILLLISCKKYDEGGSIFTTEKKLKANSWKLTKYLLNGVDKTSTLLVSNYLENYDDNYTRNYIDNEGDIIKEVGKWEFDKSSKKIKISGVSSIDITDKSGSISSSYYYILKLDQDELWYYFENGSEKHEFHLTK